MKQKSNNPFDWITIRHIACLREYACRRRLRDCADAVGLSLQDFKSELGEALHLAGVVATNKREERKGIAAFWPRWEEHLRNERFAEKDEETPPTMDDPAFN